MEQRSDLAFPIRRRYDGDLKWFVALSTQGIPTLGEVWTQQVSARGLTAEEADRISGGIQTKAPKEWW